MRLYWHQKQPTLVAFGIHTTPKRREHVLCAVNRTTPKERAMSERSDIRAQASDAPERPGNDQSQREQAPAKPQVQAGQPLSGDAGTAPAEQHEANAPADGSDTETAAADQTSRDDPSSASATNEAAASLSQTQLQPEDQNAKQHANSNASSGQDAKPPESPAPENDHTSDEAAREDADPILTSDELIPDFLRPPKRPTPPQPQPEDLPVRMVIPSDSNEAYVMEAPSDEVRRAKREKQREEQRRQHVEASASTEPGRARSNGRATPGQTQPAESGRRHHRQARRRNNHPHAERQSARNRRAGTRKTGAAPQDASRKTHPGTTAPQRTTALGSASTPANARGSQNSADSAAATQKRTQMLAVAILAIIIVAIVGVAAATGAFGPANTANVNTDTAAQTTETTASDAGNTLSPDEVKATLKKVGLSTAEANKAAKAAEDDKRISQIAANADAYKKEGKDVQTKLLELAADDPEAVDFVLNWPDRYPDDKGKSYDGKVKKGTIPQLYQWDERWGYTTYSGTTFARTGCGPTALSMVYMGLTGKTDKTPYDMGQLARADGYESPHNGTVGDFLTDDAPKLGLSCQKLDTDATALQSWLQQGGVVICNVGAGDFTDGGHFFVITGLDKKGKLTIHDPYSSVRSAKHWNVNRILGQTVALYGFTAAN